MIANVSAHRRANAFAQALEDQEVQGAAAAQSDPSLEDTEHARLLALTGGLGALPAPQLDAEVKTVQRAQLIAAMEAQFAGGGAVPAQRSGRGAHRALSRLRPRSRWSKGLAAGGLTVGVAAGAFGGVAAASSGALPGDTLYGLKRGMEDLKLGMADGDSDRGGLFLDQASTRLQEANRLMERGRSGQLDHESLTEIRRTLAGMQHDAAEGHRLLHGVYQRDGSLGAIQRLSSFTASHREGWSRLRERLPVQLTDVGNGVSSVLDAIDDEVEPLRGLLHEKQGKHGGEAGPSGAARQGSPGSNGQDSPAPSSKAPATADGKHPSGKPAQSSPSSREEHEGLLGGTGLLQPSPGTDGSGADRSAHGKDGKPSKQPDITIPPLLPNILPGLGIHGEDDK